MYHALKKIRLDVRGEIQNSTKGKSISVYVRQLDSAGLIMVNAVEWL